MFHLSVIFLPLIFTILTMTMANPCPCELIENEPSTSITDSTTNLFADDETLEDYLDQLTAASQLETSQDGYALLRQTKSLDTSRKRLKRPSWAAVGKRATSLSNKQPSWARVG